MAEEDKNNAKEDVKYKPEEYVCDDPVILDAFFDVKAAILSKAN